jgi:hypothetical protein
LVGKAKNMMLILEIVLAIIMWRIFLQWLAKVYQDFRYRRMLKKINKLKELLIKNADLNAQGIAPKPTSQTPLHSSRTWPKAKTYLYGIMSESLPQAHIEGLRETTSTSGEKLRVHRKNGKLHHPTEAARNVTYPDGSKLEEYYFDGMRHRIDAPAIIKTETDGSKSEEYFVHDKRHRLNSPAIVRTDVNGTIIRESWIDDKRHALDCPAVVLIRPDGSRRFEFWQNMMRHNQNGAAIVEYDLRGFAVHEEFWLNNKLVYVEQNIVKADTVSVDEIALDVPTGGHVRITKFSDGRVEETHHRLGKLHRANAPARIITTANGSRFEEFWYNGKPQRLDLNDLPALRRGRG